ncbi:hypothetical protein ONS95_006635 [Cadophora gregata]|uniref:uncharacterized protein n=1 Tax=Cadophora gregata TaxID=51156 RepID=UPI0026DB7A7F|nr:uncharacterized protein ONS95_006635 [Cadophora gregata]KAK0101463.1 hypothetical protein ONS95_006635 [Cadophora gregata]KAK0106528.1 hypothetical protein ONS96_004150 [Cadophora gregata f. sp. sojae]
MFYFQSLRSATITNILLLVIATSVLAADSNDTLSNGEEGKTVPLRILPLGNSITYGYQSTDGNGYRKHLLDKITTNGTAQYIGSVRSGNMTDNHNEGHPGATITQISAFSVGSLALRPNLILLMAGTNDMNMNLTLGAPERLANLVDMCFLACPDAVILLAQLTPAGTAAVEARVEQFNPSVASLATSREQLGKKILSVDMPKFVTAADLKDVLHPNDVGYANMADAWYLGIQQANARGWLTPPVDGIGPPRDSGAASVPSPTGAGFLEDTRTPVASSSLSSTTFMSLSSIMTSMNISVPTVLAIPTRYSSMTNSSTLTVPTQVLVPSVAVVSQTAINGADFMGGQLRGQVASIFPVMGLLLLLLGF